jgi:glycosyltransferase involved in cell wall biosynthesis
LALGEKMKIAFLNIYSGVIDRGAETFVKELASHLAPKNEVTVFQSGENKQKEKYKTEIISVKWDWNKKTGIGTLLGIFFLDYWSRQVFLFSLKAIPRILKEKYDIVIPVNGGWMPAIMRLITWLYGGKMIISGQSGMGWDDRNNLWCFPNVFIALSSKASGWARKINPLVKVFRIPNGSDLKIFNSKGIKYKTTLKKPIVLCVGALTKPKRIDLTIRAVAKMDNASLLVAGDGELKEELSELGRKLLGSRFQLIKLSYEEMPKIYRAADVFTLPSVSWQSFEIVLVEAMATNLPVVANNDSIRREIIGDAGVLVKPENIDAYTKALEIALYSKWGSKPRRRAEKFSWDKIAEKYEKLFKEL